MSALPSVDTPPRPRGKKYYDNIPWTLHRENGQSRTSPTSPVVPWAWHFNVFPIKTGMTRAQFETDMQDRDWTPTGGAEPKNLITHDDDLDDIDDYRLHEIYRIIEFWYNKTSDSMQKILADDIITVIATTKPSFEDFIQDEPRIRIVFAVAKYLLTLKDLQSTAKIHCMDIYGNLRYLEPVDIVSEPAAKTTKS